MLRNDVVYYVTASNRYSGFNFRTVNTQNISMKGKFGNLVQNSRSKDFNYWENA